MCRRSLLGALIFPSLVYIFGLYAPHSYKQRVTARIVVLLVCLIGTTLLMFPLFYVKKSFTIGREVFLFGFWISYCSVLIHHGFLLRSLRDYRERVAFIMTCTFDELEARFFQSLGTEHMELVGLIHYDNYQPIGEMRVLGKVSACRISSAARTSSACSARAKASATPRCARPSASCATRACK